MGKPYSICRVLLQYYSLGEVLESLKCARVHLGAAGDFLAYGLVVLAAVFQSGAIICTRALKVSDK